MARIKQLFLAGALLTLSGCATNVIKPFIDFNDYDELYLRGVFTWWEADPQYKLIETASNKYSTTIKLIADGQPYDFKFADADWTPSLNCGYLDLHNDKIIDESQAVRASCEDSEKNFQFTPGVSGTYKFSIDFSNESQPMVLVSKVAD